MCHQVFLAVVVLLSVFHAAIIVQDLCGYMDSVLQVYGLGGIPLLLRGVITHNISAIT